PSALRQDAETGDYLDRLTRRVEQLAERVTDEARQAGASDRFAWQRPLPPDVDDQLIDDVALWRAALGIPTSDKRPTGPPMRAPSLVRHQSGLQGRLTMALRGIPTGR